MGLKKDILKEITRRLSLEVAAENDTQAYLKLGAFNDVCVSVRSAQVHRAVGLALERLLERK
jgi:hypothetical protein